MTFQFEENDILGHLLDMRRCESIVSSEIESNARQMTMIGRIATRQRAQHFWPQMERLGCTKDYYDNSLLLQSAAFFEDMEPHQWRDMSWLIPWKFTCI